MTKHIFWRFFYAIYFLIIKLREAKSKIKREGRTRSGFPSPQPPKGQKPKNPYGLKSVKSGLTWEGSPVALLPPCEGVGRFIA